MIDGGVGFPKVLDDRTGPGVSILDTLDRRFFGFLLLSSFD